MIFGRRNSDKDRPASPQPAGSPGRLTDDEFLALLRDELFQAAPGLGPDSRIRDGILVSPQGWGVMMLPAHCESDNHYDIGIMTDLGRKPAPILMDCVTGSGSTPRVAAQRAIGLWRETTGAVALELFDRRERYCSQRPGTSRNGVPGWFGLISGIAAYGMSAEENRRLQRWAVDNDVLQRIAPVLSDALEPDRLNGVKVFYGGMPGNMTAEIRINGEAHPEASRALADIGWPEPEVFTVVRGYAAFIKEPADGSVPDFPAIPLDLEQPGHNHTADNDGSGSGHCLGCGGPLDPEHPRFDIALPQPLAEISDAERTACVSTETDKLIVADGIGNFIKVLLPISLDDGRRVTYSLWVGMNGSVLEAMSQRMRTQGMAGIKIEGVLANSLHPWGDGMLKADAQIESKQTEPGGYNLFIVGSTAPELKRIIQGSWPAAFVLGDRDPKTQA